MAIYSQFGDPVELLALWILCGFLGRLLRGSGVRIGSTLGDRWILSARRVLSRIPGCRATVLNNYEILQKP